MLWFLGFFRAGCIWLTTIPCYQIFIFLRSVLCQLWSPNRVLYLRGWNCLYAVLFLYVKVSLVIHYSEHSTEMRDFVSYFNYLLTQKLLIPSVHWNFCMRVTHLNMFCLFYSWLAIYISVSKRFSYLFWVLILILICFLILLQWISDSNYNKATAFICETFFE